MPCALDWAEHAVCAFAILAVPRNERQVGVQPQVQRPNEMAPDDPEAATLPLRGRPRRLQARRAPGAVARSASRSATCRAACELLHYVVGNGSPLHTSGACRRSGVQRSRAARSHHSTRQWHGPGTGKPAGEECQEAVQQRFLSRRVAGIQQLEKALLLQTCRSMVCRHVYIADHGRGGLRSGRAPSTASVGTAAWCACGSTLLQPRLLVCI